MLQQMEKDIDITFISGQEFDSQIYSTNEYGLYDYTSGKFLNLSQIVYYWGILRENGSGNFKSGLDLPFKQCQRIGQLLVGFKQPHAGYAVFR